MLAMAKNNVVVASTLLLVLPLLLPYNSEGVNVQVMERLCNQTFHSASCMECMKRQPIIIRSPRPWVGMAPDETQVAQQAVGCAMSELTALSKATEKYVAPRRVLEEECQPRLLYAEEAVQGIVVPLIQRGKLEDAENVIYKWVLGSLGDCTRELEARGMTVPTYLDNRTFTTEFRWKLALEILRALNSHP